jgi:tetratricopeptide (TPR) repeat protein
MCFWGNIKIVFVQRILAMNVFITVNVFLFLTVSGFCFDEPPSWLVVPEKAPMAQTEQDSKTAPASMSNQGLKTVATPENASEGQKAASEKPEVVDFELPAEFLPDGEQEPVLAVGGKDDDCTEAREFLKDFNSRLAAKEQVRALLKDKKYADILPLAESLICIEPENREMLYTHAYALRGLKEYEKAADSYDRLVGLYADFFDGWYERADVYRRLKATEESLASYDQAVKLKPENSWAQYDRAVHLKNMRRWDEALEGFHEAIRLNPRNSWAYYEIGNIHFWRRQFVHALKYYQETKKLNPKAPSLDENIAICEKALSES